VLFKKTYRYCFSIFPISMVSNLSSRFRSAWMSYLKLPKAIETTSQSGPTKELMNPAKYFRVVFGYVFTTAKCMIPYRYQLPEFTRSLESSVLHWCIFITTPRHSRLSYL
jgi:hypothetical protein